MFRYVFLSSTDEFDSCNVASVRFLQAEMYVQGNA